MIRRLGHATSLSVIMLSFGQAYANDVIADAGRYTVKITTAVDFSFGNERKGTSRGSGFLMDREWAGLSPTPMSPGNPPPRSA